MHTLWIRRIRDDGVHAEPTVPWVPLWTMRMIVQTAHERPALAIVMRFKQRCGLYARVYSVGLFGAAGHDLPNLFQCEPGIFWKLDQRRFRLGPFLSEIVGRIHVGAKRPVHRTCPNTLPPGASVIRHRVDDVSGKMRAGYLPPLPRGIGREQKRSFHGSDHDPRAAVLGFSSAC